MELAQALLVLAAEGGRDHTPFYLVGVAFGAWAVFIGIAGMRSPAFPGGRGAGIAIYAVSLLLAAAAMALAVIVAE